MKSALCCLILLLGVSHAAFVTPPTGKVIDNEFILLLSRNTSSAIHDDLYESLNGIKKFSIGDNYKAIHAKLSEVQLKWVKTHKDVESIEHNQIITKADDDDTTCPDTQVEPMSWGQKRITTTSPEDVIETFSHNSNWGSGVDVYILDTGVRCSHVEFEGRCINGLNTAGGSHDDVDGHGTHCAGTVAGKTYGIAKSATIIAVKVLGDTGTGTTAGVIEGVEYVAINAAKRKRPSLANMSLSGDHSAAVNNAVNSVIVSGVGITVAAGNNAADACNYSPSSALGPISVGNTELAASGIKQIDARAYLSNYGPCTDIFAPGSSIIAAFSSSDDAYATMSGTSMAAPHVAGAMAVILTTEKHLNPTELKKRILSNAIPNIIENLQGTSSPNLMLYVPCF